MGPKASGASGTAKFEAKRPKSQEVLLAAPKAKNPEAKFDISGQKPRAKFEPKAKSFKSRSPTANSPDGTNRPNSADDTNRPDDGPNSPKAK